MVMKQIGFKTQIWALKCIMLSTKSSHRFGKPIDTGERENEIYSSYKLEVVEYLCEYSDLFLLEAIRAVEFYHR